MRFLFSFFVGIFFLLLGLLDSNGFFEIGTLNIFGAKQLGGINMYFLEHFIKNLLIIPGYIFIGLSGFIDSYNLKGFFFTDYYIQLYITGLFYFIFSYIMLTLANIFSFHRDKVYLSILIIFSYLLLIYLI